MRLDPNTGCILWTGGVNGGGYGRFNFGTDRGRLAHRVLWERANGPVPEGLNLDHLCRNKLCVNVDHLEPVTQRVNVLRGVGISSANARKTHCKRGHELFGANLFMNSNGTRQCRSCKTAREQVRAKARWAAHKEAKDANQG